MSYVRVVAKFEFAKFSTFEICTEAHKIFLSLSKILCTGGVQASKSPQINSPLLTTSGNIRVCAMVFGNPSQYINETISYT